MRIPAWWFREWTEVQVVMRSPTPGQTCESLRSAAQGGAQAGDLRQTTGDDEGTGVVPKTHTIGHPHTEGDDVL